MRKFIILILLSLNLVQICFAIEKINDFPSEKEYFNQPEDKINIAEGALIIARGYYPELDIHAYIRQIETMTNTLKVKLKNTEKASDTVRVINNYFLTEKQFKSQNNIHFLNELLDKKCGNCVALASLYLAVAERLNLPFYGVFAPNHVFIRYEDKNAKINIDVASQGQIFADSWIVKKLNINPASVKKGVYLRNLNKKEFFAGLLNNRGVACKQNAKYDQAIASYTSAIEMFPEYADAWFNRGIAFKDTKQNDKAIQDFSKAVAIDPAHNRAYNNRGNIYIRQKRYDLAIADFSNCIRIAPDYALAYLNRGTAYNVNGQYNKAISDFNKTLKLDPDNFVACIKKALSCEKVGCTKEAIEAYKKFIKYAPSQYANYVKQAENRIKQLETVASFQ